MATTNKYLTYRGDIRALAAFAKGLAFATVHPDGVPTALYRLDVEKLELDEIALERGGLSLATADDDLWLGGDNGRLYHLAGKDKKLTKLKAELPASASALACLSNARLAALCGDRLVILDTKKGAELQSIELPDKGSSLAADPTGEWVVVGTNKGHVAVYDCEDKDDFQIGGMEKLHEGAVTAILFEPEELRFLSAGADQKLLLTHARGKLEPEDRGRGASHSDHVTALLQVPGERFVSVSRDKTCKTWTLAGATRPATFDDAVPAVVDAALVEIHNRPHLVIAGDDNALRFILLDAGGRFSSMTNRLYDAYDRAADLLKHNDVARRGDAFHALAGYDDTRSVEMLAKQVNEDADHGLRLRAAELLAASHHPRATKLLEPLLKHKDDKVRLEALSGLRNAAAKDDLRPLQLAIDAKQANVGVVAVEALQPLAKKDELARQLLIRTLDTDPAEVRQAALLSLEAIFTKDSPEPTMIAAKSSKADTRRLALIRAYQCTLLADSRIAGAVRRGGEDKDADVRRTAMLIALLSRDKLAKAIRERDKELHRQLFELENFDLEPKQDTKAKEPPQVKPTKFSLDANDYEPLLSAMSSRVTDTCLLGARCLALLGDSRAFGTLLQLSREEDAAVRVQVCQALAALEDSRAAQRLKTLVNDSAVEVRDAAYSALENIHAANPLEAADLGLKASHVEVRRRALKTLAASMRKAKAALPEARAMMLRALNDDDDSVSGEAFKSSLGLKLDGSPEATLRFALNSVRENVRREVLTEVMAQDKQPWAQQLLNDLLSDPSPKIRDDAYEHLLAKTKGRDIAPMQAALQSCHSDIRLRGTQSLVKLNTKAAHETLVTAIDDEDAGVREQAIKALININDVETIQSAMASKYSDVRLSAACSRALFHDEQAKTPLIETATAAEPDRDADKLQWGRDAVVALNGIGMLGFEDCVPVLLPLLKSKCDGIRHGAASAIARCARPSQVETLKEALQHSDPHVRYRIAIGMAFCQEPIALPVIFSAEAAKVLNENDRLMAAVAYGDTTETHLVAMLDADEAWIRNAAFLVLLMRDWRAHDGTPARVLAALSANAPRIRFAAARALETFADTDAFAAFIVEFVNDRGEEQAWEISAEQVGVLADLIVFAEPRCQAQMMTVLEMLAEEKQPSWDFTWHVYTTRYATELAAATKIAQKQKLPKLQSGSDELLNLAFGTYVGLVREQGGYHDRGARPSVGTTVIAIRQAAIRRLVAIAQSDENVRAATRPILIQALSDDLQAVRMAAFEQLASVGVADEARAAAALECGHTDLAVEALKLLTAAAGKKGQKVLEDVVLTRDDELAAEAGALLLRMTDATTAAKAGLESPHEPTRMLAVGWLVAAYDEDEKAKKALVAAYASRYPAVQRKVACELAGKKDERAFDMLVEQLPLSAKTQEQFQIVNAFGNLGDARSPDAILDALDSDKEKTLQPAMMFSMIGSFRQPASVDRLLPLLEKKEWRADVAKAIQRISGYDQPCMDPSDDLPNRNWMDEQHPRHDEVLARYLERCLELNLPDLIKPCIADARWSLTDAVDHVLKLLSVHPDEVLRIPVVDAIGWRFRKRSGPPDALVDLLEHRDANTKFLAAVGFARGGRHDGINILLSAVELMTDLNQRILAVQALGELGDERSLDTLLKLASEDGHALQEAAAEAIGHLGKSEKADEIFQLLKRLANSKASVATRAIVGLRWFNTPSGWDLVRKKACEDTGCEQTILKQLGYNDDPATKALLLERLRVSVAAWALGPAKRLFGEESLEPDYAALQSEGGYSRESQLEKDYHCLERVCRDGEPARIFEILPKAFECREELSAALMQRDPLPIAAATTAFDSPHAQAVEVAASIVGRVGEQEHGKQLGSAITKWLKTWNERHQQSLRQSRWESSDIEDVTAALCRLAWAAGRTQAGKSELLDLIHTNKDEASFVTVRRAAVLALGEYKLTKAELSSVEQLIRDTDAEIRQTAAQIIAKQGAGRAAELTGELLSDRAALRRVIVCEEVAASAALVEGADHAHYQAIVLPRLVAARQIDRLSEVAKNAELGEATRLGAIEGLARIADKSADQQLVTIGKDESAAEELRKAAWRGLRRSKRVQSRG